MDTFSACDARPDDPGWRARVQAQLRDDGLAVLAGIAGRAALTALARELMTIRPHRDAAPDGVTEITDTGAAAAGYAAFTGAGLVPHTDGTAVADPPQLLLLACVQPAGEGGATLVADGARVATALHLGPGEGVVLCNTRWLHGREPYAGRRVMLRVLGDPLPGAGILPGFPHCRPAAGTAVPAAFAVREVAR